MKRFKGFTMTELMVALAVIGIIVAVVTPAIMKTRPNKNKMMVKKSFYTTEQVVSTLINDARLYPDFRELCYEEEGSYTPSSDAYCAWGFDYQNDVDYEGETYGGGTKFRDLFVSKLNINNNRTSGNVYYTTDGMKWDFSDAVNKWSTPGATPVTGAGADKATILIDVNGDDEPNRLQTVCTDGVCTDGVCTDPVCTDTDDFDRYRIDVYVNGKLEINPADTKAIEYATINTSIRDAL